MLRKQKKHYIIQMDNFSSVVEERPIFLQKSPADSIVYIVANEGLFRFDSTAQSCKKIATAKALQDKTENNPDLKDIITPASLNEKQLCPLNAKRASIIEKSTEVANVYRGLPIDLKAFDKVYELAKTLISREDELLITSLNAIANLRKSESILSLLESNKPSAHIDIRDIHRDAYPHLQGIVDLEALRPNQAFVDLVRVNISGKTPHEIALYFEKYCGNHFNDSVLGEKWRTFADRIAPALESSAEAKEGIAYAAMRL